MDGIRGMGHEAWAWLDLGRIGLMFGRALKLCLTITAAWLLFCGGAFADMVPDAYKSRCAACHGVHGAGDTMIGKNLKIRNLALDEVQKQSDDELFNIISKGRNRMPAFDRKLSPDQIRELVQHIRSLKK